MHSALRFLGLSRSELAPTVDNPVAGGRSPHLHSPATDLPALGDLPAPERLCVRETRRAVLLTEAVVFGIPHRNSTQEAVVSRLKTVSSGSHGDDVAEADLAADLAGCHAD
jgi:hypothetical protein